MGNDHNFVTQWMTSDNSKCHTMYLQFVYILYKYNAHIYLLCTVIFCVFKFTTGMKLKVYLISTLWVGDFVGKCKGKRQLGSPKCR